MSSVNFNSSLYSAISKGKEETSFYKSSNGKILYGKPANQNCEKAALAEVIQAFINEKEPADFTAAMYRLQNSYILNEKIQTHNNNLNQNIFYIFVRILSFGYYNQDFKEIDQDRYIHNLPLVKRMENKIEKGLELLEKSVSNLENDFTIIEDSLCKLEAKLRNNIKI